MIEFTTTLIADKIIQVDFERQLDLCMCFLRVQEYYESPKFRGKYFTIAEFVDWYSTEHGDGVFSYIADWDGFNVPSNMIYDFYKLLKRNNGELNKFDQLILQVCEEVENTLNIQPPFYLVGTHSEDDEERLTLDHEIAHALYALNRSYRTEVHALIKKLPKRQVTAKMYQTLTDYGYHKAVHKDELQAYFATGRDNRMTRFSRLRHTKRFKELFKRHKKELLNAPQTK